MDEATPEQIADVRRVAGLADDVHRVNVGLSAEQREDGWWALTALRHEPSGQYVPYHAEGPFQAEQEAWDYHDWWEAMDKFGEGNA